MFQTITKSKSTTAVSGLLGVKLTQSLSDINDAWQDFNSSNVSMLEKVNELDKIVSDVVLLQNLTVQVQKSKLQPSFCAFLGAMEGISDIAGVDFTKVTDKNRAAMTQVACEGFTQTAKNVWKKIKEFFVNVAKAIKGFFIRLFSLNARQINAVSKLGEGVLKKIKEVDAKAFGEIEFNGVAHGTFVAAIAALNSSILPAIKSASAKMEQVNASVALGKAKWKEVGYSMSADGKFTSDKEGMKKEKKKMSELGWTPEVVAKAKDDVTTALRNVVGSKEIQDKAQTVLRALMAECDKLASLNDKADNNGGAELVKRGKESISVITKALSIYASATASVVGQWISVASKLKVKEDKKKK